ncbi:hypothetical protein [Hymenobacter properus]|uniref:Uncharacterized protein n=1 Tax=Hymenobacter properus TaxID=2791026 RepID=A0A931BEQ2_9BACT|nr:hypothetical protein [Hymenobacter properus]MBF9140927.1 hypothetical protein [Hymenobacter properus]MBR7719736.1 hypothetical protein [Microvirga sp. SRT04]
MHLHLPRRHRRPLLLPPGLLALAGLLWLGCVLVAQHPIQFKLRNVMQLTMPPRPDSDFLWGGMRHYGPYLRYSQLAYFRNWHTIEFGQSRSADSAAGRRLATTIRTLSRGWESDPGRDGLRVYFGERARYASLVLVLDLMAQYNVKKYFLDLHHPAYRPTFYAFNGGSARQRWTDPLLRPAALPEPADAPEPQAEPVSAPLWERLTVAENWYPNTNQLTESWALLAAPGWEGPLALLACIGALAIWRWRP